MAQQPYQYYGTGRRKTSVARVFLRPGSGMIRVNKQPLDEYFGEESHRTLVKQALSITENLQAFDAVVNVAGGGLSGQATAIRHGMARALLGVPGEEIRLTLKKAGLLTRDAREVERKKYGQPGARKRYQFSKR